MQSRGTSFPQLVVYAFSSLTNVKLHEEEGIKREWDTFYCVYIKAWKIFYINIYFFFCGRVTAQNASHALYSKLELAYLLSIPMVKSHGHFYILYACFFFGLNIIHISLSDILSNFCRVKLAWWCWRPHEDYL